MGGFVILCHNRRHCRGDPGLGLQFPLTPLFSDSERRGNAWAQWNMVSVFFFAFVCFFPPLFPASLFGLVMITFIEDGYYFNFLNVSFQRNLKDGFPKSC